VLDLRRQRQRIDVRVVVRRVGARPAADRRVRHAVGRVEEVAAVVADQRIDAQAAGDRVVAVLAAKRIVTVPTFEGVVSVIALEQVVAVAAMELVGARIPGQGVVARASVCDE
jgi:hypothetical protein